MKNTILFLLAITLSLSAFAQRNSFYDDFSTNTYKWYSLTSNMDFSIKNDKLHIKDQGATGKVVNGIMVNSDFDQSDDFTIESRMKLISGTTGNGILWNFENSKNFYRFLITDRDGQFAVYKFNGGQSESVISWTTTSAINKNNQTNTLKVEKRNQTTNFYINGTKVGSDVIPVKGSKVGIFPGEKLSVDYFSYSSNSGSHHIASQSGNQSYNQVLNRINNYLKTFDDGYYGTVAIENDIFYSNLKDGRSSYMNIYDVDEFKVTEENRVLKAHCKSGDCVTGVTGSMFDSKSYRTNVDFNAQHFADELNLLIRLYKQSNSGQFASNQNQIKPVQKINTDNTPPEITISYPNVARGFKPVVQGKQITITGKAIDKSGIIEVLINGDDAVVDAQGNFSKNVFLAFGENMFTVSATDIKQNTSVNTFTIERESTQPQPIATQKPINTHPQELRSGKYYALIIGNNDYHDPSINSLDEPINDASKLYNVLTSHYTFDPQHVIFLKNATYVQMIEAFDNLSNRITPNDNLLVFYAGHGWWDEEKELGYWLPSNAKKSSTAFWIRNSTISDYMGSIDTKHTLLIADACFSGSIFKTRAAFADAGQAINSLYNLPSRTAMTSGNLKEVPDKSMFLEFLVKRLQQNPEKYLSADQLFVKFRIAVMNNSNTEPQFGTIQNAGDEGGEFIFIRK